MVNSIPGCKEKRETWPLSFAVYPEGTCQRPPGQYPPFHTAVTDGTLTIASNPQQAGLSHARLHPNTSTTIDTVTPGECQKTVRRPYSAVIVCSVYNLCI
ncbi:hypothetical protein DPX16_16463 [Anabarilius grahami]|uniref:Uncharacterized protein n=1 Tax=Anabarilius grahami TaxID=495550 RepID=A0A3N0XY47_ANAGA|nr:hypothetical protein DPX16_16463 [Anabarilius grahami]